MCTRPRNRHITFGHLATKQRTCQKKPLQPIKQFLTYPVPDLPVRQGVFSMSLLAPSSPDSDSDELVRSLSGRILLSAVEDHRLHPVGWPCLLRAQDLEPGPKRRKNRFHGACGRTPCTYSYNIIYIYTYILDIRIARPARSMHSSYRKQLHSCISIC